MKKIANYSAESLVGIQWKKEGRGHLGRDYSPRPITPPWQVSSLLSLLSLKKMRKKEEI